MKIFLAHTDNPDALLKAFQENPLDFLYHQEDRTDYKIKTISRLIDELQNLPNQDRTSKYVYHYLSTAGKKRYTIILNQLNHLVENDKVITAVDEALRKYGSDIISVDRDNEDGTMIHVNLCYTNSSDVYMKNVAHFKKCDLPELEKELDKRHVGHCW